MREKKEKKRYHHGALRQACIEAGLAFLSEGHAFSIRDIAKRIGVSHGAPSRHFRNKEALLAEISEQGFILLREHLQKSKKKRKFNKLYNMSMAYIQFGFDYPHHYRLMFGNKIHDHAQYPSLNAVAQKAFLELVMMVEQLQAAGQLKQESPLAQAYHIWSTNHGFVSLYIEGRVNIAIDVEISTADALEDRMHWANDIVQRLCAGMLIS